MADSAPTPFDQGLFLVHLNRGMENFERRNFLVAERELEEARRMRPVDQRVLNLLGLVYFKREKYVESATIYRKLIDGNPDSYILHFNHGLICFKLGSLDQAEAAFLKALDLKPDNQKINFYLGNIYEKKGQHYNAIFQYRKAGANIMVKRVQAKISAEKGAGDGRESLAPPEEMSSGLHGSEAPPMLTLDDIDPEQILAALNDTSSNVNEADAFPPAPDDDPTMPVAMKQPIESLPSPPVDPAKEAPPLTRTVVRLTDPTLLDQPLGEVARSKALSSAGRDLFSPGAGQHPTERPTEHRMERRSRARRSGDPTLRLKAPPIVAEEPTPTPSSREPASLTEDEEDRAPHLYSQLRRRDDSFRYLENNLMEVTFSGKVFIKQGTIYSYSGNLTFWVKPQREEGVPPLVIVSGTGRLLLTDREREITVLQVNGEEIYVEPSHLLACQETLTPRYAIIEREGVLQPRLHVLSIEGTGLVALSVKTKPLVLTVTPGYPVNVSSADVISWSGDLTPAIVEDDALAELMSPHSRPSLNVRLEGSGKVMMEKTGG
ncbi:MAG TPA: tetratricopeptide repeat protein [Vicinamibacteria bacterium]|nr:tetratricopeptide repeat protein [Vicinamibacteria bacterium]